MKRTPWLLRLAPPAAALALAVAARADATPPDTLVFQPVPARSDSAARETAHESDTWFDVSDEGESGWLRAPFGEDLLTHPDPWRSRHAHGVSDTDLELDYNRVDRLRAGIHTQVQSPETMYPRVGARIEYSFGRKRPLYGVQFEQPLLPTARFVIGASLSRRTEHSELQQTDDVENSLALLLDRQDYRDYFEREGGGVYLAWRVPDFSTVSVHARSDRYRSLAADPGVRSWFERDRPLRGNPAIDDGESRSALVRLERLARRSHASRAGLYHWIEVERAGGALGGDFDYLRGLADLRSVFRLSPAATLSLRAVGGTTAHGTLPRQKQFTAGGVDGLRAHPFDSFRGDQLAMGQAEYAVDLWRLHGAPLETGLNAIAFVDAGSAWFNPAGRFDPDRQHFAVDGGVGLATGEDGLRVYFARDLRDPDSSFVVSVRLQRPF